MQHTHDQAREIIELLGLEPIPIEGGLFTQTWRLPSDPADPTGALLGTAIYGAVTDDADSFSAMHRLNETEIWHFYSGDPIELLLLHPDGSIGEPTLGPDVLAGHHPQVVVEPGVWMGGRLAASGVFCLFGTTMTPGFTAGSFETGVREDLAARWPAAADRIERLTRPGAPLRMPTPDAPGQELP